MVRKANIFYPVAALWLLADFLSKHWIVPFLSQHGGTYRVLGDYLRFTLAMNRGMAFGLTLGDRSRWILVAFTIFTLALIFHMYRQTPPSQRLQTTALALITGGALGNLVDRLRSAAGVVDFIDVGIGAHRFWVFNVADSGVSIGGMLLLLALWVPDDRGKKVGMNPPGTR